MEEKIQLILDTLGAVSKIEFSKLLDPWKNRMHGVMTLLAGLELSRQRAVTLRQARLFSELWILRRDLEAWVSEGATVEGEVETLAWHPGDGGGTGNEDSGESPNGRVRGVRRRPDQDTKESEDGV